MTILTVSGIEAPNTLQAKVDSLPSHLGGHLNKTHNDRGTLLRLMDTYKIKSFLDIGCGPGGMVRIAKMRGLDSLGIDGDWTMAIESEAKIHIHDFTTGPAPIDRDSLRIEFDLAWSVEFLEHVEEQYQDNYMQAFARCKYAVCTFGLGLSNRNTNSKNEEYWIGVFDKYGFDYDAEETKMIRECSNMQKPFMNRTGMFFVRRV